MALDIDNIKDKAEDLLDKIPDDVKDKAKELATKENLEKAKDAVTGFFSKDKDKDEEHAEDDMDPLLMDCIELAIDAGQISASMIQRKHRVGYARAGRILDQMEKKGCISGFEGSKPRQTLITREQFYEMSGREPATQIFEDYSEE